MITLNGFIGLAFSADADGVSELDSVSCPGYWRQPTSFTPSAVGLTNSGGVTFSGTSNWKLGNFIGFWDSAEGGNLLFWWPAVKPIVVFHNQNGSLTADDLYINLPAANTRTFLPLGIVGDCHGLPVSTGTALSFKNGALYTNARASVRRALPLQGTVSNRLGSQYEQGAPSGTSLGAFGAFSFMASKIAINGLPYDAAAVSFRIANWWTTPQEADNDNAITYSAYYIDGNGLRHQVTFNGLKSVVIPPGGEADSDPSIFIKANSLGFLVQHVAAGADGKGFPANYAISDGITIPGEGWFAVGTSLADPTNVLADATNPGPDGSANSFAGLCTIAPTAMFGTYQEDVPRIGIFGDSISFGIGDESKQYFVGYLKRAIAPKFPCLLIGSSGDLLQMFQTGGDRRKRLLRKANLNKAVVEFGTNDIFESVTFEQFKTAYTNLVAELNALGIDVIACTLMPRTMSSDNWTTLDGQTFFVYEPARLEANAWIRRDGDGLFVGHFDPDAKVSSGGKWRVDLGVPTLDGTHPTQLYHMVAATSVDLNLLYA